MTAAVFEVVRVKYGQEVVITTAADRETAEWIATNNRLHGKNAGRIIVRPAS